MADLEGALGAAARRPCAPTVTAYARCWTDERRAEAARKGFRGRSRSSQDARALRTRAGGPSSRSTSSASSCAGETETLERRVRPRSGRPRAHAVDRLARQRAASPFQRCRSDPRSKCPTSDNLAMARAADPQLKSLGRQVGALLPLGQLSSKRWPIIEASVQYQRLPSYYAKYYNSFNENDFSVGVSLSIPDVGRRPHRRHRSPGQGERPARRGRARCPRV